MPVTVVVGGQFGSEGKGKVAHAFARMQGAAAAVRVGGSNSGHTVVDDAGRTFKFRHLPTAAVLPDVLCVIGAGSYIDVDVLLAEVEEVGLPDHRLLIDRNAVIVSEHHREIEKGLIREIGSTGSGTGAAVAERAMRVKGLKFAFQEPRLKDRFVGEASPLLRNFLENKEIILIEGTQGFGLSLLHSSEYPKLTSRDTTAASFVSEVGLSPLDVTDVVMVLRSFPIRVAGESGHLPDEISWDVVTAESGSDSPVAETTTVTGRIRRVARFNENVVRRALTVNNPTKIVMNHLDYIDHICFSKEEITIKCQEFISNVQSCINRPIDYIGTSPTNLIPSPPCRDSKFQTAAE